MSHYKRTFLLCALVATPALANAENKLKLDQFVVTGTRSETALLDLAGNTEKVSQADIDFVRADHITELVNRLPGVMIQRGNGQEHLTSIRSPVLTGGAGAGSFLYLEDGIPLRAAGFANVNGLFEANTEQAGGIEVVKGPGSALYGSNAVNGLVNVLSRAPSLDLERSVDISVGPHDLYKFKGTVSNTIGNQAYRFSLNGITDGGYISDSGFDQQKMTFRHDYYGEQDTFKTLFSATNLNQETAGYKNGFEVYKNRAKSRINDDPEAYRDAKSFRLSTRWDHDLNENSYFSLTPYLRYIEMEFLMHFLPGKPVEKNSHKSAGLLAAYYKDLQGGHKIIIGTDFEYTQGSLSEVQTDAKTYFGKYPQGTHYDYDVDAAVIAPYIHTEWQVAEKTRVTAGARYEHTQYQYNNKIADGLMPGSSTLYRPSDRTNNFNNFSPKLGVVQQLSKNTSTYINLARGNRAPQTTDLYRMRLESNEAITAKSEKVDSIEVGYRKEGGGIQYEISTYYMKKKNYFFRDTSDTNVADGRTKHYGIELSTFLPLGEQFDLGGSFTYARHQYDFNHKGSDPLGSDTITSGDDMDTAPRHLANVRLGWNYLPDSRAELEWIHVGRYYTDSGNKHSYDGYDLFNLRTTYKLSRNLTIYGRISNLLNTKYAERADYNYINNFNKTDRYFVGEERNLHVGASYSF